MFYYLDSGSGFCGVCSDSFESFSYLFQLNNSNTYLCYSSLNTPHISLPMYMISFSYYVFSNQDIVRKHNTVFVVVTVGVG